jgi:hypothetical protein
MYRCRIYLSESALNAEDLDIAKKLPERDFYTPDPVPETSFFDGDLIYVWTEIALPFVPPIGLKLDGIPRTDFNWIEGEMPRIVDVVFNVESNIFFVEVDWGFHNQPQLLNLLRAKS